MSPNRETISRLQLSKLRRLLSEVCPGNPFYASKLAKTGSALPLSGLEDYSARYPFTLKAELMRDQLDHPAYGTNLTYPESRYSRCHQTSGSTGEPLRWLDTPQSWGHLLDNWVRIFSAAGVLEGDRFLFAFSFGPFIGFWSAMESALRAGHFCFAAGALTSQARLKALADQRITVLCCTPSYALHLGEVARIEDLGFACSKVRLILVAGEPGGSIPATRAKLAEYWPAARVFDHYGMTEVGPASYECPAEPGVLHIIESAYLPEVVHPETGGPTAPGQPGELVLTTLDRTGSPVLRYRTGDLVRPRPDGPCSCGSHDLALQGGILGRADDMLVVRGVNVFPSAVEEIIRRCGHVAEYRIHASQAGSLAELWIEVEPVSDCGDVTGLVHKLQGAFQSAFSLRVPVKAAPIGTLPRFEMKAKRWIRSAACSP